MADEKLLYCPKCRTHARRSEWRCVWRWLHCGDPGKAPVQVLRHKVCNAMVYDVIE